MILQLDLPKEVIKTLGKDPARKVLEAVLLQMIKEEKATVGYAGEVLGLRKDDAIAWYQSHGNTYPAYTAEDLADDLEFAFKKR